MDALCPDRDFQRLVRKETQKEARNKERQEDLESFRKMIEKTCNFKIFKCIIITTITCA
jgi:hypothetical protein